MTGLKLQAVDAGDVMTVAVGGWLAASFVFGTGFTLVAIGHSVIEGGVSTLLVLPMLFFMALFGAGLFSLVFALPTGMLVVGLLRLVGASGRVGLVVCALVGLSYAAGLSTLPVEWQWWKDFWYAAPLYGTATGIIYARTCDG